MTARVRVISEYECAVLSTLRWRAWRPWVPEREVVHAAQMYARTPARTVKHHLARYTEAGLFEHDAERDLYRWNVAAPSEQVAAVEFAAQLEGIMLARVATEPPDPRLV